MIVDLISDVLQVKIDTKGAELKSIKKGSTEYLWQGSNNSWKRSAPVLFPIIGALNSDSFTYNGKVFSMSQHGFGRDLEYSIVRQSIKSVLLSAKSNNTTLHLFPFDFELLLGYDISQNRLTVSYEVINMSDGEILFSIGGHPGFNCPLDKNLNFNDYSLQLNKKENSSRRLKNDRVLTGERSGFFNSSSSINLDHSLFKDGAIIFDDLKSDSITLKSDRDSKSVTMNFKGFPYFGIWSWPPSPENFICLEPWYGVDSTLGDSPDWSKKEGLIKLKENEVFKASYSLDIL